MFGVGGRSFLCIGAHMLTKTITLISRALQCFSKSDILSFIPEETLTEIKIKDPHPYFQAFSVCHEGESSPKLLSDDINGPITWTRKAIQSIKNFVNKGVKFFLGHNSDNSTEGRKSVGRVVAETQREINGKLHHIVISYHNKKEIPLVKNMNACSHEGVWNFIKNGANVIAHSLSDRLTGIALCNTSENKPAFSGAMRLGAVQAFDDSDKAGDATIKTDIKTTGDVKMITFEQIKQAIKDMHILPRQVFTVDDIKDDRVLGNIYAENESLKKRVDSFEKENEQLKEQKDIYERKTQIITAKDRLNNLMELDNTTDKQRGYIKLMFNDDIKDLSDESLKNFIAIKKEEYKKVAEADLFGKNIDTDIPTAQSGDGKTNANNGDYTKAANNELLDEDISMEV